MSFKMMLKNNYNKIFNKLSLALILGILFLDILPSWFLVIKSFFNGTIFQENVLNDLADRIVSVHANLLTLGFILTTFLIFRKRLTLINFGIIITASWLLGIYEFMDNTLHPLLMKTGIFSHFMRPGISGLNPQYTRLTLFLISTFILLLISFRGKTRTIDRSFVTLISLSMVVTTFLFHLAIPMGILKYTREERMNTYVDNMRELPNDIFCKNKTCMFFDEKFVEKNDKFIGDREFTKQFTDMMNYSKEYFSNKENLNNPVYGSSGDFIGVVSVFFSCQHKNNEFICAFDNKSMKSYGLISKTLFAFLVSIAHGVWIFGGLFLLSLHKNRGVRKMAYQVSHNP
jgi:hypothetical protein